MSQLGVVRPAGAAVAAQAAAGVLAPAVARVEPQDLWVAVPLTAAPTTIHSFTTIISHPTTFHTISLLIFTFTGVAQAAAAVLALVVA